MGCDPKLRKILDQHSAEADVQGELDKQNFMMFTEEMHRTKSHDYIDGFADAITMLVGENKRFEEMIERHRGETASYIESGLRN